MTDKTKNILIVVSLVFIALLLSLGLVFLGSTFKNNNNTTAIPTSPTQTDITNFNTTNTPVIPTPSEVSTLPLQYIKLPNNLFDNNFVWQAQEKLEDINLDESSFEQCLKENKEALKTDSTFCDFSKNFELKYFKIATFIYENKPGQIIYAEGLVELGGPSTYYFVIFDNKITLLEKTSSNIDASYGEFNRAKFFVDKDLELPKIDYPQTIKASNGQTLFFQSSEMYVTEKNYTAFDPKNYKTILTNSDSRASTFIIYVNGIHLAYYDINIPKLFILNDGQNQNSADYDRMYVGGCGQGNGGLDLIESKDSDLKIIGKSDDGNNLYKFVNTGNDSEYFSLYTNYNGYLKMSDNAPITYENFLAEYPIIIMKDGFGRYIQFKKTKFNPRTAECGKPVIYLYPTTETKVNVQVKPNGGLTKVDPFYPTDGWLVNAKPNGELTNISDQQNYPYLFWEGNAYDMNIPNEGFVLRKENVKANMETLLARLGLNEKETADFLEFWQTKLEVKPYVFVTFVSQTDFDKVAPLNISPKPDKVIRVFMDYQPLDFPQKVSPLKIETPTRTGFTVVEWGGRLHQ
ncbi:MAG: hypothetical protein WCV83_04405 [Candidatus Magasanikbacteria bacterium]|jgi:hypothetical protein